MLCDDAVLKEALTTLLREGVEGPPDPGGTWFVSNAADAGLLGTLDRLTAEQASATPAAGRRSIAAHAGHVLFALNASRRWITGERPRLNWKESWSVSAVDRQQWDQLRTEIRAAHAALREAIEQASNWDEVTTGSAVAIVAHVAYHLGAIKQLAADVRGDAHP
jgi:hypothetical protein